MDERLSVVSARATGHDLTVFTYDDHAKLASALGCQVIDAKVVADDPTLGELRRHRPNHFSDYFRLEGLAKGYGVWTDLDVVGWQNDPSTGMGSLSRSRSSSQDSDGGDPSL